MSSGSRQSFVKKYENFPVAKKLTISFSVIIMCILVIALVNYFAAKHVENRDTYIKENLLPIELAELGLRNHINDSLAQLRGYMISGNNEFKSGRRSALNDILKKMEMINSKKDSINTETQTLFSQLQDVLAAYSTAQSKVEALSNTINEEPATKLLVEQAVPKANQILASITELIDEEKTLPATPERKALLALLADSRGSFAVGLASIRAYLLTGDKVWRDDFLTRWDVNEARFLSLNEKLYLFTAKQRQAFSQYSLDRADFMPIVDDMFAIRASAQWNMAHYLLESEVAPLAENALAISYQINKNMEAMIADNLSKLEFYKFFALALTFFLTIMAIILAIITVKFTAARIVKPVDQLKASLHAIAKGDLTKHVNATSNDEIGQALQTLETMRAQLHTIIEVDVKSLINNARSGDLSKRIDGAGKQGAYSDLCEAVNELVAVNNQIIDETISVFSALSHGDLSQRINSEYQGDFARIKKDANFTIEKLHQIIEQDIQSVINLAVAGDFSKRIETKGKEGFFLLVSEKVNSFIDSNQAIVSDVIRVLGAMSNGDLNENINSHYQGEFAKLKDNTNNTIQRLKTIIEQEIQSVVDAALGGNLEKRISEADKQGFFRDITISINKLTDICHSIISDSSVSIAAMSKGDLTKKIDHEYHGMFGELTSSINTTIDKLKSTIDDIYESSEMVNAGSSEIALGVDDLSLRTEQQASSLEETSSSMKEMTGSVKQSASNAKEAADMTAMAEQCAIAGGEAVDSAVDAMKGINDSSNKIAAIIGVIDEIAFQTNLLALNAAVEAARAGEQGRGFAVVAGEVRTLAQRSASAAKEIKDLISDSVSRVENGSKLVNDSGQTLKEIIESVKKVGVSISGLSTASEQQYSGIEKVNTAVLSMDQMTQQNAALVEQSSAACQGLSDQAQRLSDLISFFNTGKEKVNHGHISKPLSSNNMIESNPTATPEAKLEPTIKELPKAEPIKTESKTSIKKENKATLTTQVKEPISQTAHDVDMDGEWEEF